MPWTTMYEFFSGHPYVDRTVYENQINENRLRIDTFDYTKPIDYFTYEYGWSWLMAFGSRTIGLETNNLFFLVSFLCLFIYSLFIVQTSSRFYLLLLIHPLVIDLVFSQLRIAVAIAILIALGLIARNRITRVAGFIGSATVHTATSLVAGIHLFNSMLKMLRFTSGIRFAGALIVGAFVAVSTGPLRRVILSLLGDRRVALDIKATSMLFAIPWLLLLFIFLLNYKTISRSPWSLLAISLLAIALSTVLVGGYTTRYLAITTPFLASALWALPRDWGVLGNSIYFLSFIGLWFLRILNSF